MFLALLFIVVVVLSVRATLRHPEQQSAITLFLIAFILGIYLAVAV